MGEGMKAVWDADAIVLGGDDMMPAISPEEKLRIVTLRPSDIGLGDVIVFKRYVPIAHRVVGRRRVCGRWYFVAKGDRCPYVDSPVDDCMVLGVVGGKSRRHEGSAAKSLAFGVLLSWHIPASRVLRGRAFRIANTLVRRFVSRAL